MSVRPFDACFFMVLGTPWASTTPTRSWARCMLKCLPNARHMGASPLGKVYMCICTFCLSPLKIVKVQVTSCDFEYEMSKLQLVSVTRMCLPRITLPQKPPLTESAIWGGGRLRGNEQQVQGLPHERLDLVDFLRHSQSG